ncbi:MAG TPA: cell division protein FtsZ [Candidatus Stercoripulliclostridium merdipullorum]|uniref:Cell division protein FtsZ n=1 Tax=Candidatus Stercoripulliclostridium merdipullorum TaxID=2840952 RepID=A0A9D1SWY6_9FIRM|nr:cell division protein FtsZ [Candidatus Stercoripulliclostridium merdipullorum]
MANTSGIANIKVIGVGGGGNNAVNRMIYAGIKSATFIAANTDMQALNMSAAPIKIQLGATLTKGLGAGSDPEVGQRAAEESKEEIRQYLEDTDLLFITAGMGGGTGTGAAPVIAAMAKEMGILTVAVVTKPFEQFEGKKRMENALKGIERLKENVDTLLIIPNEKISLFVPKGTPFVRAFQIADDVLRQGIQGISDMITTPSLINLDFADIKAVMKNKGNAHIGIGKGKGDNRTLDAVRQAVQSPLLETNIQGATGIVVYVVGGPGLSIDEVNESVGLVREVVDDKANIIFGMGIDETLNDEVMITIIATGFETKPDGRSKYATIQRPMFTPQETNERMSKMYGYQAAPVEAQRPEPEVPRYAAQDNKEAIPPSRMDVGASKNLPPFLIRLQEKNRGN